MNKRFLIFFGLSLTITFGLGGIWLIKDRSVSAYTNPEPTHPFVEVNALALASRSGSVEDSKELVGEIIKVAGFDSELRGFTASSIKDRVGRAENNFQQGNSGGVSEAKVVRTLNGLVRKFNLPAYVRTDIYEVRKLRLNLLSQFPQIINQKNQPRQPISVSTNLDATMSPAESVFVLGLLIQQKLANPEYQQTYSERISRWTETHNHSPGRNGPSNPAPNRSREIRDALNSAASATSISDALQLSAMTLNTLGIDQ